MVFAVVPVYNEEASQVRRVLLGLLSLDIQVVVVNDGSTTNFIEEISDLPVYYLKHATNLGQGAALQTGTIFSLQQNATSIVHFDADGQHNPKDICPMIKLLEKGSADIVLGSRFLVKEHSLFIPFFRKLVLKAARYINFIFTGILLSDAHHGLRALNRKAAQAIVFTENGYAHATQLLSLIKENQLRYVEIPASVYYTSYAKSKGQSSMNMFNILLDLLLGKIFK